MECLVLNAYSLSNPHMPCHFVAYFVEILIITKLEGLMGKLNFFRRADWCSVWWLLHNKDQDKVGDHLSILYCIDCRHVCIMKVFIHKIPNIENCYELCTILLSKFMNPFARIKPVILNYLNIYVFV